MGSTSPRKETSYEEFRDALKQDPHARALLAQLQLSVRMEQIRKEALTSLKERNAVNHVRPKPRNAKSAYVVGAITRKDEPRPEQQTIRSAAEMLALVIASGQAISVAIEMSAPDVCRIGTYRRQPPGGQGFLQTVIYWPHPNNAPPDSESVAYILPALDDFGEATQAWRLYSADLLRARCLSLLLIRAYPDVLGVSR